MNSYHRTKNRSSMNLLSKPFSSVFRSHRRGSLVLEAGITLTLSMVVMLFMLGNLLTHYADDKLQWEMIRVQSETQILLSEKHPVASVGLLAVQRIEENFGGFLIRADKSLSVYDAFGNIEWSQRYQYSFPASKSGSTFTIPVTPYSYSDGNDFQPSKVYITVTGKKYHKAHCFHLRKSKFGVTLREAIEQGYEACKNCHEKEEIQ